MSIIPKFFMDSTVVLGRNGTTSPVWFGTGFIVGRYEGMLDGEEKYTTYLITNEHVVRDERKLVMQVNATSGVKTYDVDLVDSAGELLYSKHSTADVVACNFNINEVLAEGSQISFFALNKNSLSVEEMKDTGVCEGSLIYTLGFPVSLSKELVNQIIKSPVCRLGCISRIENVYHEANANTYLIDSMVFPGNSGGPVINRPEITYIKGTPHNSSANLIGIVSQYLTYQEILKSTQTNKNRMINEENSGLAVIVSVDRIKEVVELERTRVYSVSPGECLSIFEANDE